jgi:uncharacterized protein (DUF2267 family)
VFRRQHLHRPGAEPGGASDPGGRGGVTRITLETLSRRIDPNEADDLAAQLPEEIGRQLAKVDELESFSWEEFVERIAEKGEYADDEVAGAVHHARVVMDVVDEAITGNQLENVRGQLPDDEDWDELFALAEQETPPVDEEQRPQ